MIELYERNFVFNNFRRYRKSFTTWGYYGRIMDRYFLQIGDQMQALLFKYFYEPGFRSNTGPGGFYDMFRATVIGFDFLGNVLSQPESGSYRWNEDTEVFEKLSEELVENPDDETINIPLGLGKTLYSSYEDGIIGEVKRLAYVGTFYDKIAALYVLTARDFGQSNLPNDERFFLSFYDFFPNAYANLLGAFMSGDTTAAGQVFDPASKTLQQRTFWDGTFFGGDDGFDVQAVNGDGTQVEPGASTLLTVYGLIYAMQFTSTYLDLSFSNSTRLFEQGGQTGFSVEGMDPSDYIVCESPQTHRRFVAVKTENIGSIAWRSVERCNPLADTIASLTEALESGDFPDGRTRGQTENALLNAERAFEVQEANMSNMAQVSGWLGIGAL